jgi:hypothetical protein
MCSFSEFFSTGTTCFNTPTRDYNSIINYSHLSKVIGFTSSSDEEFTVPRCSIHIAVLDRKHSEKKATIIDNKYIHNHLPTKITTLLVSSNN